MADPQKGRMASTIPIVTSQAAEGNSGCIYSIISQDTYTNRNAGHTFDVWKLNTQFSLRDWDRITKETGYLKTRFVRKTESC